MDAGRGGAFRWCLSGMAAALLAACGSASTDAISTSATTLGTRNALSEPNPAITSNAGARWQDYSRGEDYPKVYKAPLAFITLQSGQKLGVLVGLPADQTGNPVAGAFPVILTQTAYRIDVGAATAALLPVGATLAIGGADPYMIKRGYATVSVDVLGSGVSDGEEKLLGADEQEAYGEVVDWVAHQSWCNGSIGVAGTSYLGITALLSAEQGNPAIKAVFAQVPMGDAWRDVIGTGGLLNGLFLSSWLPLTQALSVQNASAIARYPQFAAQIAQANQQHIDTINDFFLPLINGGLAGDTGTATDDGDFWAVRSPIEHVDAIQVPTFIIGGSSDIFQRGEPLLYEQLKRRVTTKLLIAPGAHVEVVATTMASANKPDVGGAPAAETLLLQWFDQYLKGIDTGAERMPNVTQYVSGYGVNGTPRYARTTDWPHPLLTPHRYYLHGDFSLSEQAPADIEASHAIQEAPAPVVSAGTSPDGSMLTMTAVANDGSDCSISNVQWTLGFAGLAPKPCYGDDTTVETTQAALKYETPPLSADLYLNGPIEADIWMSTTATQAALSVRIDDVGPDGKAVPLTDGLLSAAFRAVDDTRSRFIDGVRMQPWHAFTVASKLAVTPGQAMELPIEVFPAAALIRSGHRLRIAISSSNQAQGGWATPDQTAANGGVSTIYSNAAHPSSIVLPVVPTRALN
jgi:putative CocE/NonD family hydrolase